MKTDFKTFKALALMIAGAAIFHMGPAIADNYGLTETGGVGADVDLNGTGKLLVDADADSYVSANTTDDYLRFYVANNQRLYINSVGLHQSGGGTHLQNISTNMPIYINDSLRLAQATIADGDATPSVSGAYFHTTSANTGATEITDLDNVTAGAHYVLCGGSATNATTIADSGNFNLTAAITLTTDTCITLYVQADNDYLELSRAVN
jgi:hypothetical protein